MQVKQFQGKTLSEALELAKSDLGEDIVLLESRQVPLNNGGLFAKSSGKKFVVSVGVEPQAPKVEAWNPPAYQPEGQPSEKSGRSTGAGQERFNQVLSDILSKNSRSREQEKTLLGEIASLRQELSDLHKKTEALVNERSDEKTVSGSEEKERLRGLLNGLAEKVNSLPDREQQILEELAALRNEVLDVRKQQVDAPEKSGMTDVEKQRIEQLVNGLSARFGSASGDAKKILESLNALRNDLHDNQERHSTAESANPLASEPWSSIYDRLIFKGVSENVAESLFQTITAVPGPAEDVPTAWAEEQTRIALKRLFKRFQLDGFIEKAQKKEDGPLIILLVGPTGVGKSNSAARLAAQRDLLGELDCGILSLNRFGVSEELRKFCNQSDIDLIEVRELEEIPAARLFFDDKQVVIVDTPGRSPYYPNHLSYLDQCVQLLSPDEIFAVLSVTTDIRDIFLSCGLYMLVNPTGLILTKFDETTQPGKVFSVLSEVDVPLVCFSENDRATINARPAKVEFLLEKVFESL